MRVQGLEIGTKFRGNDVPKTDNWDTAEIFWISTTANDYRRISMM
jgi:hypothetical protein